MRLYTFEVKRQHKVGVEREGKLVELPFKSMLDLINASKDGLARAKSARGKSHDLKRVKLLAPIPG